MTLFWFLGMILQAVQKKREKNRQFTNSPPSGAGSALIEGQALSNMKIGDTPIMDASDAPVGDMGGFGGFGFGG